VQHDSAHQWLRAQLLQVAQASFGSGVTA